MVYAVRLTVEGEQWPRKLHEGLSWNNAQCALQVNWLPDRLYNGSTRWFTEPDSRPMELFQARLDNDLNEIGRHKKNEERVRLRAKPYKGKMGLGSFYRERKPLVEITENYYDVWHAYKVMMSEDSDWMKMMAEFDGNMENRLEFVKIHLCMLAATRLRSKYLDVEHARFWISRPCQFEGFIRHVWKIVERFMRVDAWIQYVFDDLHNIVMECGGHYLTDLKVKALAEIAKGSAAVTEMRTTSSDALYWLRTRYPPRKQRNA